MQYPLLEGVVTSWPGSSIKFPKSQNHGIVWAGGDLKAQLIPPLCHGQGHLPLSQVVPSSLEHFQRWGREKCPCDLQKSEHIPKTKIPTHRVGIMSAAGCYLPMGVCCISSLDLPVGQGIPGQFPWLWLEKEAGSGPSALPGSG